jgi:hypothetical protein
MQRAFDQPAGQQDRTSWKWTMGIAAGAGVKFADGIELGVGWGSGGSCRQHDDAGCGAGADRSRQGPLGPNSSVASCGFNSSQPTIDSFY